MLEKSRRVDGSGWLNWVGVGEQRSPRGPCGLCFLFFDLDSRVMFICFLFRVEVVVVLANLMCFSLCFRVGFSCSFFASSLFSLSLLIMFVGFRGRSVVC